MSSRIVDPRLEEDAFLAESRSDAKRAERVKEEAMARLAADLCQLSVKKLEQLQLPEELFDAVGDARAISSAPARNRQLRQIRALLRDQDWVALRTRLDVLLETGVVPGARLSNCEFTTRNRPRAPTSDVGNMNDSSVVERATVPRA